VITELAGLGRRALHGEGAVWTTLFALLLADVYFLPVPGALPSRFLSGPLDLGTPAFPARRREAIAEVLAAVRAGEGPDRVRGMHARRCGEALAGAAWDVADADTLAAVADGVGGGGLAAIVERLLVEGFRAAAGLPDLVVLPGDAVEVAGAFPARLPASLVLAEVKGPGDTVRDEQAVWMDRLVSAAVPVELWRVRER
jgi:Fanconi-associated nuclease 1